MAVFIITFSDRDLIYFSPPAVKVLSNTYTVSYVVQPKPEILFLCITVRGIRVTFKDVFILFPSYQKISPELNGELLTKLESRLFRIRARCAIFIIP